MSGPSAQDQDPKDAEDTGPCHQGTKTAVLIMGLA
jgi:hypothetical protein